MKKSELKNLIKEVIKEAAESVSITHYRGSIYITPSKFSDPKKLKETKGTVLKTFKEMGVPFSVEKIEIDAIRIKGNIDIETFNKGMSSVVKKLSYIKKENNEQYYVK